MADPVYPRPLARSLEPEYAYFSFDEEATLAFARTDPAGFVAALPEKAVLDEVQQLTTQAGWTDPDLRFWHYRHAAGKRVVCRAAGTAMGPVAPA